MADISALVFKGRTFDTPTTIKAVEELRKFRKQLLRRDGGSLVIFNRDLAGFFTSIPRESIIESVRMML